MTVVDESPVCGRVPIQRDLLTGPLSDLARVTLAGCRCVECGETSLGIRKFCPNCGSESVSEISLSTRGTLWSYTVVRHRPPGDYKGPEPFVPFGLGLVELPEGVRVLSPIHCAVEHLAIGQTLRLTPIVRKESNGTEVVLFAFEPTEGDQT
jgi:uncharacterized protein